MGLYIAGGAATSVAATSNKKEISVNRTTILSVIGLFSLGFTASLQVQAAMGETEKAVEAMEQLWVKANNTNDVALEATLLAEKFIAIGRDGKVQNKDQYLADEKATKYTHVAIENVIVHAYGAAAIATYAFTSKGTGSDGKPMDLRVRSTDTWLKMPDGKWQCVASVGSPLKP